ncbi:MAG: ribonuclease H-like domain-containing protein [Acidobacteriota bacterium]
MHSFEDRLSRISALRPKIRPTAGTRSDTPDPENREEIVRLLKGTIRSNARGSHVLVRRSFDEPAAQPIDRRAVELLQPDHSQNICDPESWLFLDTETTGLSGGTGTYAFLVGVGWWESGRFVVEQFFMRDHSEEPSLLYGLLQRLEQRPVLVTYNGKSFDWPLLETRYRMARVGEAPQPQTHLDLLYPARRLWRLRLNSVALTQLETHVLGFDRGRDIPSATIPQLYFNFLRGGSPRGIAEVLHHNRMDICGLAFLAQRIMDILSDPENKECCASELFGVSRLLQQRGDLRRAEVLCRMAVEKGLPETAERTAKKELALAAKRRRDFLRSNEIWENLLGDTVEGLKAYEQLAIYHEHHVKNPEKAAKISRDALGMLREAYRKGRIPASQYMRWHASLRHRLNRLASKIEKGH